MKIIDSSQKQPSSGPRPVNVSVSGENMDRRIEAPPIWRRRLPWILIGVILAGILSWQLYVQVNQRALVVNENRIAVSAVTQAVFEDFIPVRGRVTPKRTIYLDAVEGGRVEEKLVEDGALVKRGDLLVVLSNTALQLSVTQNEAAVTEQLNNMRTIELQLEQNRLEHKRSLVDLDYQITRLERQVERFANLDNAGVAAKSQLEDAQDELTYNRRSREVRLESQASATKLQENQLRFLKESGAALERNLDLARKNLEALNVRAPADGKLSGLDLELGQSIARGGRLGQIDDPNQHKLRADIDEFYLGRVDIGQSARYESGSNTYLLTISKIYPQVKNGQFQVDLVFDAAEPSGIRRGQTLQARLTLGDSSEALLIPNGAFYQDTGGNWIFVLNQQGTEAIKRNIRLGRRNARYIEVLEGLEAGEKVITSPYSSFKEMDRLTINES